MRREEIQHLANDDPELYVLALAMEAVYRCGRHFRGDHAFTVKAERKQTGEKVDFLAHASSEAQARRLFRRAYDDTVRPHKYRVAVYRAVPGLGRSFAWKDVPVDRARIELLLTT